MSFETYRQQIGVRRSREVPSVRVGRLDGPTFGDGLGAAVRGIANAAAPELERKAQEQGLEIAARAKLVRDENGNYMRPERPTGGTKFLEAYDRSIRERHALAIQVDAETRLNDMGAQLLRRELSWEDYATQSRAYVDGLIEAAPDDIQNEIFGVLNREWLERYRGHSQRVANQAYEQEVTTLAESIKIRSRMADPLWAAPGDDEEIVDRIMEMEEANQRDRDRLVELGAVSEDLNQLVQTEAATEFGNNIVSRKQVMQTRQLTTRMGELSDEDLASILTTINTGADLQLSEEGAKLLPFSADQLVFDGPGGLSGGMRQMISNRASGILVERAAIEQARLTAEREAAEAAEEDKAFIDALTMAGDFGVTMPKAQSDRLNAAVLDQVEQATGARTPDAFISPEGQNVVATVAATTGVFAPMAKDFAEAHILNEGATSQVIMMIDNFRGVSASNGRAVGMEWFDGLDARTRAIYHSIKGGILPVTGDGFTVSQLAIQLRDNSLFQISDIQAQAGGREDYVSLKREVMDEIVGKDFSGAYASALSRDLDEMMPVLMAMNGNDVEAAMREGIKVLGKSQVRSSAFTGGRGPAWFANQGVTKGDIMAALPEMRNHGYRIDHPDPAKRLTISVDGRTMDTTTSFTVQWREGGQLRRKSVPISFLWGVVNQRQADAASRARQQGVSAVARARQEQSNRARLNREREFQGGFGASLPSIFGR